MAGRLGGWLPWLLLVAVVAAHGLLDVRRRARLDRGPKFHRTDFTVYLAASEALAQGGDPYEARSPRGWRYVYPPLLAILLSPLRALPVPDAAFVFYLVGVAALVLAYRHLAGAIGRPSGRFAAAAALCLSAPFLLQTFQRGQVTTLLLATQTGALVLLLRGRDAWAGALLALGAAIRLTPALPAAVLGIAALRGVGGGGLARALRLPLGFAAGAVACFVLVPVLALGPARAAEVTGAWLESSRSVYASAPGELAGLERDYAIREHTFKNQGVRRVAATWMGGEPSDEPGAAGPTTSAVDTVSWIGAALAVLGVVAFGWRGLSDRASASFRRAYALAVLAPVFVTRYAWPVHYVVAIPFLAECLAGARGPFHVRAAGAFALATALFYAGHAAALRALPERGVLLAGAAVAAAAFAARDLRERRGRAPGRDGMPVYADGHPFRHLHRLARWRRARLDEVAGLLPARGLVVDLGAGEGLLAHRLARRSPEVRVLAVDHDEGRLARLAASEGGAAFETRRARIEDVRLPRCAGVAAVDVLHYLDPAAQERVVRGAFAALEPGGVLVVRDPDAGAGLRFAATRAYERVATASGVTRARIAAYREAGAWEALLEDAGFEARTLPRPRGAFAADRVVVGRVPGAASA